MIVCHCNRIDHREIEAACETLQADDGPRLLTPASVYKALGKRPRCGGCLALAANLIQGRLDSAPPAQCPCLLASLCDLVDDRLPSEAEPMPA